MAAMFKNARARPFALVVGGELNGLGVVRSLARAGVPTVVADTDTARATMQTRFAAKRKLAAASGDELIHELLRLRGEFEAKPVLILTQEAAVASVSEAYGDVTEAYRISMPDRATMAMLMNKALFQAQAEALGFAIPRSIRLLPGDDGGALDDLRFPCVLKPVVKNSANPHRLPKAHRLEDAASARALWRELDGMIGEAIVQEWIEGGDSDVYFCLAYRAPAGEAVSFTGRKTCQWPPLVGGTATCMPAPEAEAELNETTSRFFAAVGFTGLGSMEYKRDRRDGRFYMVEPTVGRTDYQEEVATLNGVNLPYAAWLGEQGLPLQGCVRKARAAAWRDPYGHHNAGRAGARDAISEIAPNMAVTDAYFRASDPGPYVADRLKPIREKFGGVMKHRASPKHA
ncbi:MAG TPA: hypothetical protein VMU01_08380 [Rhizomicrobium sp.]|nr:hypothetical protein [Rhizomicrobium sp.]